MISDTSNTGNLPSSRSFLAVPPEATRVMLSSWRDLPRSSKPVLSETERRAVGCWITIGLDGIYDYGLS